MTQDNQPSLENAPTLSPTPILSDEKFIRTSSFNDPANLSNRTSSPDLYSRMETCNDPVEDCQDDLPAPHPPPQLLLTKIRNYVLSLRPWSFTASLPPALLGFALAYASHGVFSLPVTVLGMFTVLTVHAAGNIINTYFDYVNGIDRQLSDDRTLVDAILTPGEVVNLATGLYALGTLSFFILSRISPAPLYLLSVIYFGGFYASYVYTGGTGLKYIACGDILIFFVFGPMTTLFTYVAASGHFSTVPCWYSVPLGLLVVAILHANNVRDMETDASERIKTLALVLGETGSLVLFVGLLYLPCVIVGVLALSQSGWFFLPLLVIPWGRLLVVEMRAGLERKSHGMAGLPQQTAVFAGVFGVLYVASFLLMAWRA